MTTSDLAVLFVNDTGLSDEEVFVSFQNPHLGQTDFKVTLSNGNAVEFLDDGDLMSIPVSLADIGKDGLSVSQLNGAIVYVSYGARLKSRKSAPSYIGSGGEDYDTPFQPFELTRMGEAGDQGDLTAINFFTAPMAIQSFAGGPKGKRLQSVGYVKDTQTLVTALKALTHSSPDAVIRAHDKLVRIIGPSSYAPTQTNPYPTLQDYVKAVHKAGQATRIANHNAFNVTDSGTGQITNYDFALDFTATAAADGSITLTGEITTSITKQGQHPLPGPTFKDCVLTLKAVPQKLYDYALYGQVISDSMSFTGDWQTLEDYINSLDLDDPNAYAITQNLAVGEITSGLLMGFVNSDIIPDGHTTALKDMPSKTWWTLDPVQAFSSLQPAQAFYNAYADVLYWGSDNSVYSIPYSDRLGTGPLVNSVQYNSEAVDTWVITLGRPVSNV